MADRWQPMMLILVDGRRVECEKCGALATVMAARQRETEVEQHIEGTFWCQSCYQNTIAEEDEEE